MLLELEHGIVFVQQAGQTLYMPPFCTHVSMGIENCTSAYYYVATATQFPAALKHIPWRVAVIRREAPEMHQTQLADYASAILYTLEQVLRGDFDKALNIVALHKNMCDSWNENKDKVYALCAAIEDPTKADGFKDGFKRAWIEFLERKCVLQENGKKLATCQLCKNPINKMSGNKADRLVRHFLQKHWPRADANGVQEAVDKVEIARFTEGKAHQIGKARKGA
ncbi:hypothetical protein BDV95DRAFT_584951 [Massariosphaeria phaeospora]|uniref:JmjC domain-containing protein n=1 Tax=Massariosphaeria phaeospora TaxID=100035 RepID=A0A7C8HZD8_9PLEO|nr:hypothetical protein BDV95DRAFT_584951 [Massariosphaeria phaeospora]